MARVLFESGVSNCEPYGSGMQATREHGQAALSHCSEIQKVARCFECRAQKCANANAKVTFQERRTRFVCRRRPIRVESCASWLMTVFLFCVLKSSVFVHATFAPTSTPSSPSAPFTVSPSKLPSDAITAAPLSSPDTAAPVSPLADPSNSPSSQQLDLPTTAPSQSIDQTGSPTSNDFPTPLPIFSKAPIYFPTSTSTETPVTPVTPETSAPSQSPITSTPSRTSPEPTLYPTSLPSAVPTSPYPTFLSKASGHYRQRFILGSGKLVDATGRDSFEQVMESYTPLLAINDTSPPGNTEMYQNVTSICTFVSQLLVHRRRFSTRNLRILYHQDRSLASRRNASGQEVLGELIEVNYVIQYRSLLIDVSEFPELFLSFVNESLVKVTQDMQDAGVNFTQSFPVYLVSPVDATDAPSESPSPSPSHNTSITNSKKTAVIAAVSVGIAIICLVALFICQKRKRESAVQSGGTIVTTTSVSSAADVPKNINIVNKVQPGALESLKESGRSDANVGGFVAEDSLKSHVSLISAGTDIGGNSIDEADNTHFLADEFDQFKDQNLERMRSDVEGTVKEVDGMMSQAMTYALLDDDEIQVDQKILCWGGLGDPTEIEATALCEVHDWQKRHEGASIQYRRGFMQEILNKMVSSVRHGVMEPEQGARTIHECAAMLGLPVAVDLDEVSLIVTGMRKTVKKVDLIAGFKEFGLIDYAAISSNARGFGIVRFLSPSSAQRALVKYKKAEVVVQDVAVTIKVLSSADSDRSVNATVRK